MTGRMGKITAEPWTARAKNGTLTVLFVQVKLCGGSTVSVQYLTSPGDDSWPMRGDIVAVYPVGGILVALAGKGTEKPAREPGEREIYSRDKDGKKAATHSLKTGGGHFIGNSKANMRETLDKVFDALTVFTTGLAAQNLSEKAAGLQASLSEIKIYAADFLEAQP